MDDVLTIREFISCLKDDAEMFADNLSHEGCTEKLSYPAWCRMFMRYVEVGTDEEDAYYGEGT